MGGLWGDGGDKGGSNALLERWVGGWVNGREKTYLHEFYSYTQSLELSS